MKTLSRSLLVGSLLIAAACGPSDQAEAQNGVPQRITQQLGNVPAVIDTSLASRLSATFRGAAERALPAVVYIQVVKQAVAQQAPSFPGFPPGFFGQPAPQPEQAAGSGFIYDESGLILTNNHVVSNTSQVVVQMLDGRQFDAKVVGRDPNTDVAVIRITPPQGEKLPAVQIGNSDNARVGDWVIALGNPLGQNFTVTAGIISAKGRNIGILGNRQQQQQSGASSALEAYIQTDAAINPGNSGGPLIDLMGRVVAMNSAIESPTGTFVGIGFAIPVNLAMRVASDLVKYGAVHRPRLGIVVGNVDQSDAEAYGLPSVSGALVNSVQSGTPAEQAGLQPGDVIVAVNGTPVKTSVDLTTDLAEMQPGNEVTLTLYRDKRRMDVRVKLGEFETERASNNTGAARPSAESMLGIQVEALTPDIAQQLGINRTSGVVITNVSPLSPAAGKIGRGDVIESINGQKVNTVADLERIAGNLKAGNLIMMRLLSPRFGQTIANFTIRS